MHRRQFLQYGGLGGAVLLLAPAALAQTPREVRFQIRIEPTDVEMIDGKVVFMLLFYGESGARPVLRATEGDRVVVQVTNNDVRPHGFSIAGAPGSTISAVAPGATRQVAFTAPRGGTYLYTDPTLAPLNRILGLHGAFVVDPAEPRTAAGVVTPFSRTYQTEGVRLLFGALGATAQFPGRPWLPAREKVWLFSQVDPALNRRVDLGQTVDPATVTDTFKPRYFTLNGLSGYDAAHDPFTKPKGYVGEPLLLRVLNAGIATHAPHIHGNHVYELSGTNAGGQQVVRNNLVELDSWTMGPLERKDMLLPFVRPTDVPDAVWPPKDEPFPFIYPMHCHIEMSQTAGGGNYPQGLITDWELLGPTIPAEA